MAQRFEDTGQSAQSSDAMPSVSSGDGPSKTNQPRPAKRAEGRSTPGKREPAAVPQAVPVASSVRPVPVLPVATTAGLQLPPVSRTKGPGDLAPLPARIRPDVVVGMPGTRRFVDQARVDLNQVSADPNVVTDPEEEPNILLAAFACVYALPSWLISFIVHLSLLVLLAFLVMPNSGMRAVVLQMTDSEKIDELNLFELMIEPDDADMDNELAEMKPNEDVEDLSAELEKELDEDMLGPLDPGENNVMGNDIYQSFAKVGSDEQRGAGTGAKFYGTGASGNRFVFVIDCSGSMANEYRWTSAKRELKEAIEGLNVRQRFFVFLYNDRSHSMMNRTARLLPATKKNKRDAFKWLDAQSPIGDTRPWTAMRSSLRMEPDAIFLLSDGELRDDTVSKLKRYNKQRTWGDGSRGKTPVHTISLGNGFGAPTMRSIAEQNSGTFTRAH